MRGQCEICRARGEVKTCEFCGAFFCAHCGDFKKRLCKDCLEVEEEGIRI